ncbi:uncharacterized protein V6R79_023812 [Siganus canaliculatus]
MDVKNTLSQDYDAAAGVVEVVTGIPAGTPVSLVEYRFPEHFEFLELNFTLGDTTATVHTKKPLDADVLDGSDGNLYFAIKCTHPSLVSLKVTNVRNVANKIHLNVMFQCLQLNVRQLTVSDINDNGPIFSQDHYNTTVSETTDLGAEVIRVHATDADITTENNRVTYSIEPAPEDFTVTASGIFQLKNRLNYNVVPRYNFIVTARDNWGLNSTATVLIEVEDFDNLNPSFSHNTYKAFIQENQSGPFRTIEPDQIKAQDGDTGINVTVTYSISEVFPDQYTGTFSIDNSTGVVSVETPIDREEMTTEVILVSIKASQTDDSSKTAHAVVSVTVEDVNDNAPQFDQTSYSVSLMENSPVDDVVFRVTVTDKDQGGFEGSLRILEPVPFSIDPDGTVRVNDSSALDRETTESFIFQIEATEKNPPNNIKVAPVTVTLLDENDNNPVFTSKEYQGKVFANQTEGMELLQVQADDQDEGTNGKVKYSIEYGNDDNYFSIQGDTGAIALAKTIPMEENKTLEFILIIKATDGGVISRSSSVQVKIYAPGDSKPQFLNKVYHGTIEEEQNPGAVILRVDYFAIGDSIISLQVETEADKFNISPTGELTTKVKLDYDEAPHSYSVRISISDGVNSDTAVVEIQVTDINDNSPAFSSLDGPALVPEDAELGSNVTAVPATDKDSGFNKEIRYWLRGGEGKFTVDRESGTVSLAGALDRETMAQYSLEVVAEDQGQPARSATASLLVQVLDINDNVPKFSQVEYQVDVSETGPVGTSLLTLSAVDPDDGVNGAVTYSIVEQSPSSVPAVFELDSSNGTLLLVQPLDYSKVKEYRLLVQASDGGTPSLAGTSSVEVKVQDVNNNPPEFNHESYNVSVSENLQNGLSILTLEVTDRDEGGFVGTLRVIPDSAPFSISNDGTIRVSNSTALDREITETIVFQVEARETEQPDHVAMATVNVTLLDENDNNPKFTSSNYESQVFSNQTVGMSVVKVEAQDPDTFKNGQITYSIDFGNEDDHFVIDENTGVITLKKLIPLQANQTSEFFLLITATDGGTVSRFGSAQVKILAVGKTRLQFTQSSYSVTTEEERDPGTVILKVDYLTAGEIPVTLQVETEADKFNISSSGELTTKVKLDYDEAPHSYSVRISISDGVNSDTAVVEVQVTDINDNSPAFSSLDAPALVPEDAELGFNVTAVPATDKDSGFNKEIRYWLRGGEGKFTVDPESGTVSLAGALDRETMAQYSLEVVAEDQGRPARSATASLLVQLLDINDNVPKFSQVEYQVEVSETGPVGTSLLTLSAVDPDDRVNGAVTYSIVEQSPSSVPAVFELDSSNGTLLLVQPLDYSKVKEYRLLVQASDGGTPSLVGNSSVVVKVLDVNNNPPEFSQESYNVSVSENLPSGSSVLTLEVTDRDEGGFINGYFLYTSDTFDINEQGVVSLMKNMTLDRETKDHFVLQVVAVDQATDGLSSTAQLTITVLDYNDNAPQFPEIPDPLQISEGNYTEAAPGEIFSIVPTDADVGLNGEVTVSLASPHPLFRFREDGMLLAVGSLDRESRETYELIIRASDKGSPQRESFTTVRVNLTDVNDNRPEFSSSSYVSSILLKDAVKGKLLLTLSATDRDVGSNALITYSFSAGNSPHLALDSVTGAVTLTSDLAGITEDTTLELTAMAVDHGLPPLSSTASVMVNLRVSNIVEGVFFTNSSYSFIVRENQPAGAAVGRVLATSGSDLYKVTYSLKTHTDLFNITADGAIQTRVTLDKEQREWYVLDVEAVDTRTPSTSAVAKVTVQVENVNEPPTFLSDTYSASVLSNAPYRTPIVQVQALDPDAGESARLVYTMSEGKAFFEVEPSTGVVYLVSVAGLTETSLGLTVTATDPEGLRATTRVLVTITETESSNNAVVISLNQPEDTVEKKVEELEKALGDVLGWTVSIITVSGTDRTASQAKTQRDEMTTLVSFIAIENTNVVPSEDVIKKLRSHSDEVEEALAEVFQADVDFEVESDSSNRPSNDTAIVVLGVLFALSVLALICVVVVLICLKRKLRKERDSDGHLGYMNNIYADPKQAKLGDENPKDQQQRTDSNETARADRDSLTVAPDTGRNRHEESTSI